ncbi:GH22196 [Drosophila grimshawi]|nr:GH22196 [Drosophila grimshawi]
MEENVDFAVDAEFGIEPGGVHKRRPYIKKFMQPDSDEDVPDLSRLFNVHESWRTLLSLNSCQRVMVT